MLKVVVGPTGCLAQLTPLEVAPVGVVGPVAWAHNMGVGKFLPPC